MLLKVVHDGVHKDIPITEGTSSSLPSLIPGEMFLLPGNVPHSPIRYADTVGIVVEQNRPADSMGNPLWKCRIEYRSTKMVLCELQRNCV